MKTVMIYTCVVYDMRMIVLLPLGYILCKYMYNVCVAYKRFDVCKLEDEDSNDIYMCSLWYENDCSIAFRLHIV